MNEEVLEIDYTNHRGERSWRRLKSPMTFWFAATEWYPEPQWYLMAWDVDRHAIRWFTVKNIHQLGRPS